MPIRQNILRKGKAPKQNLLQFDVLQEESGVLGDLTTSNFFKISEFPSVLPSGNSSFLIEGSNLLKPNVELKTELLDADGNPIFHYAIPNYDKELPARRIAIEIYDDEVVNGVGSFTVLGELNPTEFDIQSDFQNTYNVRFTAPISINKKIKNTEPIRFYGDPSLTVSELIKGVIEKVPTGDSTQVTITGSVEFVNPTPQTEFSVDSGSTTGNSNQFDEVGNSVASYVNQNQGSAQSSILPQTTITTKPFTFVVKEMEKGVDNALNKITSGMKGAVFSITRPDNLVDNTLYPDSKFAKPQTFETKILDVINSTTFTTTTEYVITNKSNNNKIVVPLQPSSSQATITHNVVSSTETEDQVFKRSFANMTVGNLRTFSGDTYKAKIYMKEEGTSGEFEKIYETLVESPNELVNKNSISGFENIGIFFTQSLIENNWVSASNNSTTPSASVDDDVIIDGVLLSGSNAGVGDSFTFVTKTNLELEKNEDYIVEFNSAFKKAPKTQSDGTSKQQAELEVFITGSLESETVREISLGTIDLPDTINPDFQIIQQKQIADFITHNASSTPTGSLGFRVNSGEFILSDIRLRPFTQTNFSPGFFKANVPMPKPIKRGKLYDFLVEFYDANNNLAETVAIVDNVSFQGPPQIIVGSDNLLTGSMFLGSVTGSGIEAHGGSAYIKSVGYPGFESSSASGVGGFMMFSGSVSESLGTSESYDGVGLELVSGSNRFLRFRTTPSVFEVVTDTFFFGSGSTASTGSFVSGSNGNIEISSSNFHLDVNGDVTLAGEITAEVGGTIGGFSINDTDLTATNFVLDTDAKRLSIGTGDAIFVADADEGIFLGNANSGSAPFRVNREGDLVASSVTITGEVNATSGTAATSITALGFATASLTSSVVSLDASASAATQSIAVNVSSSAAATTTAEVGISGSTSATTTAEVGISGSTSATTTGEKAISGSDAVTSDMADTRAQLVLDNSTANNQKINLVNTTGGIMSSFGKGVKFFGSASNALVTSSANGTVNYSEVNDKGFLIVTGSTTASFFGNTTTIGDTTAQHISIEPDSISIKTADDVTVLSASAAGIVMSGSVTANEGTIGGFTLGETSLIAGSGTTRIAIDTAAGIHLGNNTFGSAPFRVTRAGELTATSVTITGDVNATGGTTATSIAALGVATSSLSGSVESINTETGSLQGNVTALGVATASLSGSVESINTETGSLQAADTAIGVTTGSLLTASSSMATQVKISSTGVDIQNETGGTISRFSTSAKFFGSASLSNTYAEVSEDGLTIVSGSVTQSFFGDDVLIGNTGTEHLKITDTALEFKDTANITRMSMSADGIEIGDDVTIDSSGNATFGGGVNAVHIKATSGSIGGWVLGTNKLSSSVDTKLIELDTGNSIIFVQSGSAADPDRHKVALDGARGIIEVSQSGVGIFNSGESADFITGDENIVQSLPVSSTTTAAGQPITSFTDGKVKNNFQMRRTLVDDFFRLDNSSVAGRTDDTTKFIVRLDDNAATGGNVKGPQPAQILFDTRKDYSSGFLNNSHIGQSIVFSDEIIMKNISGSFVGASNTGSAQYMFQAILGRDGLSPGGYTDAQMCLVDLQVDTSDVEAARQNEYVFLQARHSGSVRAQIQHDGDIVSKGNLTAFGTSFLNVSDKNLKKDIYQISESLDKINELRPTKFTWKETNKQDVGFIAQEVEQVIPEVVEISKGFINVGKEQEIKTISYPKLVPYLVDTIKELTKRIEDLEKKVK